MKTVRELIDMARTRPYEETLKAIRDANMKEHLFPLTRALEFLTTGNPDLLERLDSIYKPITEAIVEELQQRQKEGK